MTAPEIQKLVSEYSSLTRFLITMGWDAARGVMALIDKMHGDMSPEDKAAILAGVAANTKMRLDETGTILQMAAEAANQANGGTLESEFGTAGQDTGEGPKA